MATSVPKELHDFRNFLYLTWKHLNLPDPTPTQYDIAEYTAELQESLSKYKWFIEQYTALMNEYNQGIVMSIKQKERPSQSSKQQQRQSQQPKEGGE